MKNVVDVKVRNLSRSLPLPKYETDLAAGMDVMACFDCNDGEGVVKGYSWYGREMVEYPVDVDSIVEINPGERILVQTGLKVEIPEGYEIQVRPRSGKALKEGLTVLNTPGTIDADYRGMIGIILINHSNEIITIKHGDKIAQIVLKEVPRIHWKLVEDLSTTNRGEGGFGSTTKDENPSPEEQEIIDAAINKADKRTPSFQEGDQLEGVGKITRVLVDPKTGSINYEVDVDGDLNIMSEKEILDIVL